jgi:hypothetical protein
VVEKCGLFECLLAFLWFNAMVRALGFGKIGTCMEMVVLLPRRRLCRADCRIGEMEDARRCIDCVHVVSVSRPRSAASVECTNMQEHLCAWE